jgi:hypothetical protein
MKKINPTFIILLSTFISVIIMGSYNINSTNLKNYTVDKSYTKVVVNNNKEYVPRAASSDQKVTKALTKDSGDGSNTLGDYKSSNIQEKLNNESKDEKKVGNNSDANLSNETDERINKEADTYKNMKVRVRTDSLEDYYDNKEREQLVFKVSTGKIMENLSISDKVRLLYVSMQLGKENYKKVEAYLYADNAADGVLKALKLLREELAEKEYKKVRKIAGKFIDMDAAESLN